MAYVEQLIGWGSAALLVMTIVTQIVGQWRAGTSAGVSPFLFLGQFTASTGLGVYSYMGEQWVFLSLNVMMALAGIAGLAVWAIHRRRDNPPAARRLASPFSVSG